MDYQPLERLSKARGPLRQHFEAFRRCARTLSPAGALELHAGEGIDGFEVAEAVSDDGSFLVTAFGSTLRFRLAFGLGENDVALGIVVCEVKLSGPQQWREVARFSFVRTGALVDVSALDTTIDALRSQGDDPEIGHMIVAPDLVARCAQQVLRSPP